MNVGMANLQMSLQVCFGLPVMWAPRFAVASNVKCVHKSPLFLLYQSVNIVSYFQCLFLFITCCLPAAKHVCVGYHFRHFRLCLFIFVFIFIYQSVNKFCQSFFLINYFLFICFCFIFINKMNTAVTTQALSEFSLGPSFLQSVLQCSDSVLSSESCSISMVINHFRGSGQPNILSSHHHRKQVELIEKKLEKEAEK